MKIHRPCATLLLIPIVFIHCACQSPPSKSPSSKSASLFGSDAVFSLLNDQSYVKIEPGAFMMGSPDGEEKGGEGESQGQDERPQHRVTITREFEAGKYEVTQKQWQAVMGSNPSVFKGLDLPVINVSWNDVQDFIKRLQSLDEKYTYRLPTEAEWEYACRAGSLGAFSGESFNPVDPEEKRREEKGRPKRFSTSMRKKMADEEAREKQRWSEQSVKKLQEIAWFRDHAQNRPHAVGLLKPNAWELFDIHGNVLEWVQDWYDRDYYKISPVEDPQGPAQGQSKVQRGGNWQGSAWACRAAIRTHFLPVERNHLAGFRLVRTRK